MFFLLQLHPLLEHGGMAVIICVDKINKKTSPLPFSCVSVGKEWYLLVDVSAENLSRFVDPSQRRG